jgi:hypothetical protein
MNEFHARRRNCQIGTKAIQNVHGSQTLLERLITNNNYDEIVTASLFSTAVIRYAKPFLTTKTEAGETRYSIKDLKRAAGFVCDIHEQLISLRNTLIAHDDVTQIEPRMLFAWLGISGSCIKIPTQITIANKCVSYPAARCDLQAITSHVRSAYKKMCELLSADIEQLRHFIISNPGCLDDAPYTANYGSQEIPAGGKTITPSDYNNDPWLIVPTPDFSVVQNGFRYEHMQLERNFFGPEVIKLENGETVRLTPKHKSKTSQSTEN